MDLGRNKLHVDQSDRPPILYDYVIQAPKTRGVMVAVVGDVDISRGSIISCIGPCSSSVCDSPLVDHMLYNVCSCYVHFIGIFLIVLCTMYVHVLYILDQIMYSSLFGL